jgi:hypothetical protein
MDDEKIYILCSVHGEWNIDGSYTELTGVDELYESLRGNNKPNEIIFGGLSEAYHTDTRLARAANGQEDYPAIASIVFLNLSKHGFNVIGDIQTTRKYLPGAVFILYGSQSEYKRFKSEISQEWSDKFEHYFKFYKTTESNNKENINKTLDIARVTAIRKRDSINRELQANKVKVLTIFANPKGSSPLRLSTEDRVIHESLSLGKYRERVILHVKHAATIHDVRRALLEDNYDIVHFSGHGTGQGLAFENELGEMYCVPQKAFAEFMSDYSPPVKCVILNACYSDLQGKLISLGVPYTIAMNAPISDKGAIEFTRGFYDAIVAGKDINFAYKEGCRTITLMDLADGEVPVLFTS